MGRQPASVSGRPVTHPPALAPPLWPHLTLGANRRALDALGHCSAGVIFIEVVNAAGVTILVPAACNDSKYSASCVVTVVG